MTCSTKDSCCFRSSTAVYPFSSTQGSERIKETMATVVSIPVPGTNRKIAVSTGLFINNEFVPSVDSKELLEFSR